MKKVNRGVIYIATGDKSIKEALYSAKSLKLKSPQLEITLYTDQEVKERGLFTEIIRIPNIFKDTTKFLGKIKILQNSPYQKTLYLDSDTYILEDITELFVLLEKFDIAMAHAKQRNYLKEISPRYRGGMPESYPEHNTGVILYKNNKIVKKLFEDWERFYINNPVPHDQPGLREALWKNALKIATLAPEYNLKRRDLPKKDLKRWRIDQLRSKIKIAHLHEAYKMPATISYIKARNKNIDNWRKNRRKNIILNPIPLNLKIKMLIEINKRIYLHRFYPISKNLKEISPLYYKIVNRIKE